VLISQGSLWLSTGDSLTRLVQQQDLQGSAGPVGGYTINIDRSQQFQAIKGFGAALSNSAAYLFANSFERQEVLQVTYFTIILETIAILVVSQPSHLI